MRVTIRCGSREHLEYFVKLGAASNTGVTLDNLARFLGATPAASPPA